MLRFAFTVAIFAILVKFAHIPFYFKFLASFAVYIGSGGLKWLILVGKTFKRDMTIFMAMFDLLPKLLKHRMRKKGLKELFHDVVKKDPSKLAFVDADTKRYLTFNDTEVLCNKIANTFNHAGFKKGDTVGLLMENRIEYMPIWLGLSMRGIITACINYNLRGDSLKHCLQVGDCKAVIVSKELMSSIEEINTEIDMEIFLFDSTDDDLPASWKPLDRLLEEASPSHVPRDPTISGSDKMLYLYTSGTTGLPKAVIFTRKKLFILMVAGEFYFRQSDTIYNPLPLYHANALWLVAMVLFSGGTAVIKKKFSASQYMEDCCRFRATCINYIGEICRYILSQPRSVFDEMNSIRLALGNGLRASIWEEFRDRFKIGQIIEAYGSTEGNTRLNGNFTGKVGAIGFRELILPNNDLKLVKMNEETGEIERDKDGIAIAVDIGQPGQAVGKITNMMKFDGYTNEEATRKKIGHDIFRKGDSGYLTGDMLIRDEEGYYYFHDRTGDTFRWKGENVSTNEVEGLISKVTQLTDVSVYGVEVPGCGGKAGMACISDPERKVDICTLPLEMSKVLPSYAQPMFLRLSSKVDVTGTYKFQKNILKKESFNPSACPETDQLFFYHKQERKYLTLTEAVYQKIMNQEIAF